LQTVHFQDTSGRPVAGYLRCSKAHHKSSDLSEAVSDDPNNNNNTNNGPPSKKSKKAASANANKAPLSPIISGTGSAEETHSPNSGSNAKADNIPNWNLANFHLLADCVSALTKDKIPGSSTATTTAATTVATSKDLTTTVSSNSAALSEKSISPFASLNKDDEFVCILRVNDNYFVPVKSQNSNLLMITSILSTDIPSPSSSQFEPSSELQLSSQSNNNHNSNNINMSSTATATTDPDESRIDSNHSSSNCLVGGSSHNHNNYNDPFSDP
jgi:hypothetical protein